MQSNRKVFCASVESVIRSLVVLAFLVFLLTQCRPVWAGSNVWTRIGPEGVNLAAVAIDPQNPSTVYAANKRLFSIGTYTGIQEYRWRSELEYPLRSASAKSRVSYY